MQNQKDPPEESKPQALNDSQEVKNRRPNESQEERKQGEKETHDRIELRSEKVRKLIGEIPPSLVRWGFAIIVIVFLGLVAAMCLLPYPYSDGESILRHIITQKTGS